MDSDDDWLNDDNAHHPQGGAQDPVVKQEWERLTTKYSDVGYREGISEGKLAKLQEGFDSGFAAAVPIARRVGQLRGRAHALLGYLRAISPNGTGPAVNLINQTQELLSDLGKVKSQDIFPVDEEAVAHAREHEEHPSEKQEMVDLETAFEGMAGNTTQIREEALLNLMENRLGALVGEAGLQ